MVFLTRKICGQLKSGNLIILREFHLLYQSVNGGILFKTLRPQNILSIYRVLDFSLLFFIFIKQCFV